MRCKHFQNSAAKEQGGQGFSLCSAARTIPAHAFLLAQIYRLMKSSTFQLVGVKLGLVADDFSFAFQWHRRGVYCVNEKWATFSSPGN